MSYLFLMTASLLEAQDFPGNEPEPNLEEFPPVLSSDHSALSFNIPFWCQDQAESEEKNCELSVLRFVDEGKLLEEVSFVVTEARNKKKSVKEVVGESANIREFEVGALLLSELLKNGRGRGQDIKTLKSYQVKAEKISRKKLSFLFDIQLEKLNLQEKYSLKLK